MLDKKKLGLHFTTITRISVPCAVLVVTQCEIRVFLYNFALLASPCWTIETTDCGEEKETRFHIAMVI